MSGQLRGGLALLAPLARLGLVAGVAASLVATPVLALSPDPMLTGGLFGLNQPLLYRWSATATPPAIMRTAINEAAGDANATRRAKAPTFTYDAKGANVIAYGGIVPCGVNGLACFSRWAPDGFGLWFRENGHRFDWGTLRWCEIAGDPDGCYEAETIALDELGHVTGLDHHVNELDDSDYTDAVVQAYSRTKPLDGWNAHVYGRCDVAALQQAYGLLGSGTLVSTCLDLPTKSTLAAGRSTIAPGGTATFTATLATDGTGRLAGEMLAGRGVMLQRWTAAGWVDAVSMAPGATSGTYTASFTLWATTDLRAVFRRTTTEGLRASASGTTTVTVSGTCTGGGCILGSGGTNQ